MVRECVCVVKESALVCARRGVCMCARACVFVCERLCCCFVVNCAVVGALADVNVRVCVCARACA